MSDLAQVPDTVPADTPAMDNVEAVSEGQDLTNDSIQEQPFFAGAYDDGEEYKFSTPDELKSYLSEGYLRRKDYTKKTQQVAEMNKALKRDQELHKNERLEFQKQKAEVEKIRSFLNSLPEPAYQKLLRDMEGTSQKGIPRELSQRIEAIENQYKQKEQAEAEKQRREAAFNSLKKKYPDFDRTSVEKQLQAMQMAEDPMVAALEMLHLATKGRTKPEEIREAVQRNIESKSSVRPLAGSSSNTPTSGGGAFKTLDEARAAAYRDKKIGRS
jgi:hypothetical protein